MRRPGRCYNSSKEHPKEQTYVEPIRTAEVNSLSGCKACISYKGEGKAIVFYDTKLFCMSRGKNNLHFYYSSIFSKVLNLDTTQDVETPKS